MYVPKEELDESTAFARSRALLDSYHSALKVSNRTLAALIKVGVRVTPEAEAPFRLLYPIAQETTNQALEEFKLASTDATMSARPSPRWRSSSV